MTAQGFDKDQVLDKIRNILSRTPAPGGAASLEAAGWVERVIARDGQVNFVVNPPPDLRHEAGAVRRTLEEQVGAIPGVNRVQVLEKSAQGGPAAPPQPNMAAGAEELPGVKHIIAVASGKGGVGKSTVSVNLAVELARNGKRVGLLDSDVYGPSIPKMLGLEGAHPKVVGQERIVPVESHGVHTISIGFLLDEDAPVIWRGPMVTGLLRQFLFQVEWGELDYLIIDMPPGTGDAQLTLVQNVALSGGIIVTTPQDVALLDVQRGIEMFRRVEVPVLGIVENMSLFTCPKCGHEAEIFPGRGGRKAAEKYGVPFLGAIPLDPSYAEAGDQGRPITDTDTKSSLAQVLQSVAAGVIAEVN